MTKPIKTNEEYKQIVDCIKRDAFTSEFSRYSSIRLRKKEAEFLLIDGHLYLKSSDDQHKKVLIQSQHQ
ncbi:MAG: hypothetical protein ACRCZ9_04470 [Fusobacteriaceae bacterium]